MDGYYALFIIGSVVVGFFTFVTWVTEEDQCFKLFLPIFLLCFFMIFLPIGLYQETTYSEKELSVTVLDGAYYAKIDGDVVNLNNKLCRNFSSEDKFFVKVETKRYKVFGEFVEETPFVKESNDPNL
jgi:hypothetical protein